MDIKIYGTDTSGHQLVKSLISELLLKAKIPFNISEVNDVSKFLAKGIDSIPAIQMNSQLVSLQILKLSPRYYMSIIPTPNLKMG